MGVAAAQLAAGLSVRAAHRGGAATNPSQLRARDGGTDARPDCLQAAAERDSAKPAAGSR